MRRFAVLLAAALMLGACSSTDTAPSVLPSVEVAAPDLLADAVRATQAENTASAEFGFLDENQIGRTTITGTTAASLDGRFAVAEFAVGILGQESSGRMRIVDGVRYVATADEERWTSNQPDDEARTDQVAARLQLLLALDVELVDAGSEEVAGVTTTTYTYDQADADGFTDQFGQIWIDDEGRIRQFQFNRVRETNSVTSVIADLVTFLEFGVEVTVEAPSADLVDPGGAA